MLYQTVMAALDLLEQCAEARVGAAG
jgi:hypothetical protein